MKVMSPLVICKFIVVYTFVLVRKVELSSAKLVVTFYFYSFFFHKLSFSYVIWPRLPLHAGSSLSTQEEINTYDER